MNLFDHSPGLASSLRRGLDTLVVGKGSSFDTGSRTRCRLAGRD